MKFERLWGIRSKQGLDTYTNFGDPIEEDSMFMRAECQYEQKKVCSGSRQLRCPARPVPLDSAPGYGLAPVLPNCSLLAGLTLRM